MGVQPDRMILPQDPAQVLRDPLGKHHRSPGSDPDNFHMGNFPEVFQQVFQDLVVDQQPVSAGEQHIAHRRRVADIFDACVHLLLGNSHADLTGKTAPGAVAAIHGTLVGD